jgi:hypothetical protein
MKFPAIPGKTPREQFENLVRLVFSVPKKSLDKTTHKEKMKPTAPQKRKAE